jgi:hypothetical protein
MDIIDKLIIDEKDLIKSIDGCIVFLDKPLKMDNLPIIDETFINKKYLQILKDSDILEYFKSLLKGEIRICALNGIMLYTKGSNYYCDYCRGETSGDWYYCYNCRKDMCKLCYEEINEEVALKNGAKNYKLREHLFKKCRDCHIIEPRLIYNIDTNIHKVCDLCENKINETHYSLKDYRNTFDICIDCFNSKDLAKENVKTKGMNLIEIYPKDFLFYHSDFKSMLYWVPVLECNYYRILINLNPEDKNYNKICLQGCDDHCRCGYFILKDGSTLNIILQKLQNIIDTPELDEKNSEHFNPIEILMEQLNMSTYYG